MVIEHNNFTIIDVLRKIEKRILFIPSIQREFVWTHEKVEDFFDSILSNYPIGLFLFWEIKTKHHRQKYNFYEFEKEVELGSVFNSQASPTGNNTISVLDGQQRLTALYSGIYGFYKYKTPGKWKKRPESSPPRILHLNLFYEKSEKERTNYKFKFLTKDESKIIDKTNFWFPVNDILEWAGQGKRGANKFINSKVIKSLDNRIVKKIKKNKDEMVETLVSLYHGICHEKNINVCSVFSNDIDPILNLFIRVNSGGIILSRTDLLFSTISAKWKDAKSEVNDLREDIKDSYGFIFNKDLIMRTCLMVVDQPILFSVKIGFSRKNITKIEDNWENIRKAILEGANTLKTWGVTEEHLKSKNSIIPIFYYYYKGGLPKDSESIDDLKKYFLIANAKNIFGSHGDTVLHKIRELMVGKFDKSKKNPLFNKKFNFERLMEDKYFNSGEKSMKVDNDVITHWLEDIQYPDTFFILYLLYPHKNFDSTLFHQDHIHPQKFFKKNKNNCRLKELEKISIPTESDDDGYKSIKRKSNCLPNLMFLPGSVNQEKRDMDFKDWVTKYCRKKRLKRDEFLKENYITNDINNLEFLKFNEFYENRKRRMTEVLMSRFKISQ